MFLEEIQFILNEHGNNNSQKLLGKTIKNFKKRVFYNVTLINLRF